MKVFMDSADYDMIEHALIELGRTRLSQADKDRLTKIMQKLNTMHTLSPTGKISMEPAK